MSAIWIDHLAELDAWKPDEGRALLWRRAPNCTDRLAPATAADLADADALKTPRLAAARLYRRRVLRTLASRALGARAGSLKIERLDTGESRLTAPIRLRTSLAERDGWILAGVCAHAIGVDVEVAEPHPPLPLDLLSANHRERVLAAPNASRACVFAQIWTELEAAAKASDCPFVKMLAGERRPAPSAYTQRENYLFALSFG
jgi:phosphopantetheinyl transferase